MLEVAKYYQRIENRESERKQAQAKQKGFFARLLGKKTGL
tara:strand:- start:1700 stop:1819 length:120 start_codon:yes stop_codon:yes gene_type:complete